MAITDIPILSMLRTRLDWAQARQRVLAENVANSDTPKFHARDLAPLQFDNAPGSSSGALTPVSLSLTADSHIQGVGSEPIALPEFQFSHLRSAPGRQCGEPRGRNDESCHQPDGFPGGDGPLHTQPQSHQDRAWQALSGHKDGGGQRWISSRRCRSQLPACVRKPGACASFRKTSPMPNSTPQRPGADPYRRKIPTFRSELDRTLDTTGGRTRQGANR